MLMNNQLNQKYKDLVEKLQNSTKILITMSAPDGDSFGSALALYNEFTKMGKEVVVQSSFEIPKYLKFIPLLNYLVIGDIGQVEFSKFDMVVIVDAGDPKRVVKYSLYPDGFEFPNGTYVVVFDHHLTHVDQFAQIDIIDHTYSSTCELVVEFFEESKIDYDSDSATLLFVGIYTDTGGFIHSNATSKVFNVASRVLAKGAQKELIMLNLEKTQSSGSMLLSASVLKTMEIIDEDGFSYVIMRMDKDIANDYSMDEIEDAMNVLKSKPGFIRNVENTDFGILISQNKEVVGVSFRARTEKYDLSKICERFGGGGHKNACAFKSRENIDDLIELLKQQIKIILSEEINF